MPVKLVLVDDHPIVLEGLAAILEPEEDFALAATCTSGAAALRAVREHRPDVLVLDLRIPDLDGLAVLRALRSEGLTPRVVLLTGDLDEGEMRQALELGVAGVVLKEMAPRLLVQCVRKVHAGGQWLEQRTVGRVLEQALRREAGLAEVAAVLTPRQIELARAVASGLANKEVAQRLHISEGTVKVHLHAIYERLAVSGRAELQRYLIEKGVL
jgi:DNA-binding NarL/FixJ family response regulator